MGDLESKHQGLESKIPHNPLNIKFIFDTRSVNQRLNFRDTRKKHKISPFKAELQQWHGRATKARADRATATQGGTAVPLSTG